MNYYFIKKPPFLRKAVLNKKNKVLKKLQPIHIFIRWTNANTNKFCTLGVYL